MAKAWIKKLTASRLAENALLHHILHALATAQFPDYKHRWDGRPNRGSYVYENGTGDVLVAAWGPWEGVGLVYSHESPRGEEVSKEAHWSSLPWLADVPRNMHGLLEEALNDARSAGYFPQPTAGLWADNDGGYVGEDFEKAVEHGLWMFERYAMSPRAAVLGKTGQNWMELTSVSSGIAHLALDFAKKMDSPPVDLGRSELRRIAKFAEPKSEVTERVKNVVDILTKMDFLVDEEVDLTALGPSEALVEISDATMHRFDQPIEDPLLEQLQLRAYFVAPTGASLDEKSRTMVMVLHGDNATAWDTGQPGAWQPRATMSSPSHPGLEIPAKILDDPSSMGIRRVLRFEAPMRIPPDAQVTLSFLLRGTG